MVPLLKDQVQKTDYLIKLTLTLFYILGVASTLMAAKNILKNTYNFSVHGRASLLRNIQTVIPVEKLENYMVAFEKASIEGNIDPFTVFLFKLVKESLKGTPVAKLKT